MTVKIDPMYQRYFSSSSDVCDWSKFKSTPAEILKTQKVDFSIDCRTWLDTAKKVALTILKIVLFPWGLYEVAKYFVQRLLMIRAYPAQSGIVKFLFPELRTVSLDKIRQQSAAKLDAQGYIVRHVCLEKNGVRYSGMMIGHRDTIDNGKWMLQASGNIVPIEYFTLVSPQGSSAASYCKSAGFNLLLVNGPNVGRSQGTANPETMGDAQDIGMSFLETAVKAKKMVIAGHSLGGIAIASGILQHEFKTDQVDYHVISQQTFDKGANLHWELNYRYPFLRYLYPLIPWSNTEIDAVDAAKKLSSLGISHTVINAGRNGRYAHDGVIPGRAALGHRLHREKLRGKTFVLTGVNHSYPIRATIDAVRRWDAPLRERICAPIRAFLKRHPEFAPWPDVRRILNEAGG